MLSAEQAQLETWDGIERRNGEDRRDRHLWHRALLYVKGGRQHARRESERQNYYVDRYNHRWMWVSVSILVLCCLDAIFTLNLIRLGIATEANPVMRVLIEHDLMLFMLAKYTLTVLGLFTLLMHKNFRVFKHFKVGHVLCGLVVMYALLIKYELWLFSLI